MKNGIKTTSLIGLLLWSLVTAGAAETTAATARSYVWLGELVALDDVGKTLTAKARIPTHVTNYINRFKPADHLVVVWDMIGKSQAETILYLSDYASMKNVGSGYILPIEFVSADTSAKTMTFKASVPERVLRSLKSVQPGSWIKVTTPMDQPSKQAAISTVEAVERPKAPSSGI